RFAATWVTYSLPSPATNVSGSCEKPRTNVLPTGWACAAGTSVPTVSASATPRGAKRRLIFILIPPVLVWTQHTEPPAKQHTRGLSWPALYRQSVPPSRKDSKPASGGSGGVILAFATRAVKPDARAAFRAVESSC